MESVRVHVYVCVCVRVGACVVRDRRQVRDNRTQRHAAGAARSGRALVNAGVCVRVCACARAKMVSLTGAWGRTEAQFNHSVVGVRTVRVNDSLLTLCLCLGSLTVRTIRPSHLANASPSR
jgi:hypothetical protein